jgi:hypothetical protein
MVAVTLFAAYVVVQRGQIKSYDGSIMVNLATRLLTHHTFTIDPARDSLHLQSPYASYGLGTTLLALPFDALQRAVAPGSRSLLTLANPLMLASCGALLFLIGRRLGWRSWVCVLTALGFGVLTTALWHSTEMFSEPGVAFAALLLVYGALSWQASPALGSLSVGLAAAIALLFRPDSLLLVLPLALMIPFLVSRAVLVTRRTVISVSVPIAVVGIFQLWYDHHRFGSILDTGMSNQARGQGFNTPILQGLGALLHSPGRGFLWSSPILLLALPGMVWLYRRNHPLTIAIGAVVVARFLFFARWFEPGGGVGWGPRLLFAATALLAIPAGEVLEHVAHWQPARPRHVAWAGIGGLAVVSGFVALLSISVGYERYWNEWRNVPKDQLAERAHAYYFSLAHNPIVGQVHMLRTGAPLAPIHFRHGPDAVGVIALLTAIIAGAAALVAASRERDDSSPAIILVSEDDSSSELAAPVTAGRS